MDECDKVAYAIGRNHQADDGGGNRRAVFEFGYWVAIAEAQIYGMGMAKVVPSTAARALALLIKFFITFPFKF